MIDLESMIKSLRLAWLKRIFEKNDGAWKSYLPVSLQHFGGLFLFYCNYDIKDHSIPSLFYSDLIRWWSEFRDGFDSGKEWQFILWNNKISKTNFSIWAGLRHSMPSYLKTDICVPWEISLIV